MFNGRPIKEHTQFRWFAGNIGHGNLRKPLFLCLHVDGMFLETALLSKTSFKNVFRNEYRPGSVYRLWNKLVLEKIYDNGNCTR